MLWDSDWLYRVGGAYESNAPIVVTQEDLQRVMQEPEEEKEEKIPCPLCGHPLPSVLIEKGSSSDDWSYGFTITE